MAYTKYDAIILDSDIDTRMRLKQATNSVHQFGKVLIVGSIKEAMSILKAGEQQVDVIFISGKFDQEDVTAVVRDAKETKYGADAAYILVLKSKDQDSSTVAANVMIGADGFLFEPYSVDYLVEITQLAAKVKKERAKNREAAALTFLINDIIHQIDVISYLKSCEFEVGRGLKAFKQMCQVFQTLEPESLELYYDIALDKFENAPLPASTVNKKKYSGASSRVKKRMQEKLLSELEEGANASEEHMKKLEKIKEQKKAIAEQEQGQ